VISPANLELCFISGHPAERLRARWREGTEHSAEGLRARWSAKEEKRRMR
jgi:hypothetical protein